MLSGAARFFGTSQCIVGQTIVVIVWIALNAAAIGYHWEPYPFILLNLAFSTQAAYAAPLILLAQTRQAERDKVSRPAPSGRAIAEEMASTQVAAIKAETDRIIELLNSNTELTRQNKELTERVETLTREIHERVTPA